MRDFSTKRDCGHRRRATAAAASAQFIHWQFPEFRIVIADWFYAGDGGGGILRAIFGRLPAAAILGVGTGALAWFFAGPVILAVIAGVIAFVFTLLGGGRGLMGGMGGFGRGGLGGGGLGGGGGGFGGGGASGRW